MRRASTPTSCRPHCAEDTTIIASEYEERENVLQTAFLSESVPEWQFFWRNCPKAYVHLQTAFHERNGCDALSKIKWNKISICLFVDPPLKIQQISHFCVSSIALLNVSKNVPCRVSILHVSHVCCFYCMFICHRPIIADRV